MSAFYWAVRLLAALERRGPHTTSHDPAVSCPLRWAAGKFHESSVAQLGSPQQEYIIVSDTLIVYCNHSLMRMILILRSKNNSGISKKENLTWNSIFVLLFYNIMLVTKLNFHVENIPWCCFLKWPFPHPFMLIIAWLSFSLSYIYIYI